MQIYQYQTVTSTQDLAKKYLEEKNKENATFIAQEQTSGYGKRGRSFYSPAKTGVYLSVALPNFKPDSDHAGLLTLAIGVEVVKKLKDVFSLNDFRLKWVNDIYLNDKKVAGILTEQTKFGLVIGVGINISTTDFPNGISDHVGSIAQKNFDADQVSKKIIDAIIQATKTYQNPAFLNEYRAISYLNNKKVTLKIGHQHVTGKVITIDDQGRIILLSQNTLHSYSSGAVVKVKFE